MSNFKLPKFMTASDLVAVLVETKKFLRWDKNSTVSHSSRFICYATEETSYPDRYINVVRNLIHSRLGRSPTVEHWLGDNVSGLCYDTNGLLYTDNGAQVPYAEIQAYRHRWLDSLIEEFSGKKYRAARRFGNELRVDDDVDIHSVTETRVVGTINYKYGKPVNFNVKRQPNNCFHQGSGSGKITYYLVPSK